MLTEFQQALADLTSSPALCERARRQPDHLSRLYHLTEREFQRLVLMVRHPGMRCACIVYRANRLAPLAMNVPDTCKALGRDLRRLADEFWSSSPETNVHFFVEADRFCRFLEEKLVAGERFSDEAALHLHREGAAVAAALIESRTEDVCQIS